MAKNYVSTLSLFVINLTFADVVPTCTVPRWKGNSFYFVTNVVRQTKSRQFLRKTHSALWASHLYQNFS